MWKKLGLFGMMVFSFGISVATASAEEINSYQVSIDVLKNGKIAVTERIDYDFGLESRHGIYRDIPVKYWAHNGVYKLRLSDVSVTDERNKEMTIDESLIGSDKRIKIGDADILVTGKKTYVIRYTVGRAINFFEDHDELYWNAIGTGWIVPIANVQVDVRFPDGQVHANDIRLECFTGATGDQASCYQEVSEKGINFMQTALLPTEGMTIVVGFPKGIVIEPSASMQFLETLKDNGILALPVAVFVMCFFIWRKYGRDPKGRVTIIPQYEAPKGLSPAEVGLIVDEWEGTKDVVAEILFLASKGFLSITRTEKKNLLIFTETDYILNRLRPDEQPEKKFQQELLKGLFGKKTEVKLSNLKQKFSDDLHAVKTKVYESLKGVYFSGNPRTRRAIFIMVPLFVAWPIAFFLTRDFGLYGGLSGIISGLIMGVFGFFMPSRTLRGVLAREEILGLKRYIEIAEKDRINFHNAPEKNPQHFEELLPYAVALGVEKKWAEQFKDLDMQSSWYHGPVGSHFTAMTLVDDIGDFSGVASSTMSATKASSGGSGFSGGGSGGGFGGGGGGSW
ncbi:MAG: DUF2207 domain-containing protein [Candidatus Moranbacteria bacterium]|jgi:uncharacterized membrane protein YgcG|nr:DUF2207 domain-containing protein [Candidatus Moranbacteria bacterium]